MTRVQTQAGKKKKHELIIIIIIIIIIIMTIKKPTPRVSNAKWKWNQSGDPGLKRCGRKLKWEG